MEYEYSFEVRNLEQYIKYCISNNYTHVSNNKEKRIIFRNKNKTMARITISDDKDIFLDFKDDILNNEVLIERRETPKIKINNLEYKEDNTLERTRIKYKKGKVTFELDQYIQPKETCVVAIEGEKEDTDDVYKEVRSLIDEQ